MVGAINSSVRHPPQCWIESTPMTDAGANHLDIAWALFRRHWRVFALAELAVVAAWLLLEIVVVAVHRLPLPAAVGTAAWVVLHLGFLWLFCALMTGIHAMALQAVDGGVPLARTVFSRLDGGLHYLAASLLYWPAVLVGLCLAIVPGVVVATRWGLFRWVLADAPGTAVASLQEASSMSSTHRWVLARVLALSVALNLGGAALLGVGLLIAFPVTLLLRARYFRGLQQPTVASVPAA